jgi:O-antigen/teichoic acid export membrane protein
MLIPGSLFALAGIAEYLNTQSSVMVVQSMIGGAAVTQLATQRTMVNMSRMIASQITSAMWPEVTALDARGERAGLVRVHRTMAKVVSFLIGALLLALLPVARLIYGWWTLKSLSFDPYIYAAMAAQTILWGVWSSSSTVLVATNRQRTLIVILALNACATVALSILLVPRYGIRGAALAGLLADLAVVAWATPRAAVASVGDRARDHLREVVLPLGAGLLLPALPAGLVYWLLPWPSARIFVAPLVGLPIGVVAFYWMLAPVERAAAKRVLEKVRARLRRARGAGAPEGGRG